MNSNKNSKTIATRFFNFLERFIIRKVTKLVITVMISTPCFITGLALLAL